jgi:benzoyl-CoA-dihydrodiol lyase
MNFGAYPAVNHQTRLLTRFCGDQIPVDAAHGVVGSQLPASLALELGLVTFTPDDIDWSEEVRLCGRGARKLVTGCVERDGSKPALRRRRDNGDAHLRTLSAWQNWVFSRPNAVASREH